MVDNKRSSARDKILATAYERISSEQMEKVKSRLLVKLNSLLIERHGPTPYCRACPMRAQDVKHRRLAVSYGFREQNAQRKRGEVAGASQIEPPQHEPGWRGTHVSNSDRYRKITRG